MSLTGWQGIFSIILWIGIVFTGIGTIGSQVVNNKIGRNKEKITSEKIEKLDEQNKELITGKNELIAQNKELGKELADRDKKLKEIAEKDIYKALSPVLRQQIISNIRLLQLKDLKEIIVSDINTNNNGKRVVSDLVDILTEAGVHAKRGTTGMVFGTHIIRPQVKMSSDSVAIAEQLCKAFLPYLMTRFSSKVEESLGEGVINIIIHGTPLFHEDGTVEFN